MGYECVHIDSGVLARMQQNFKRSNPNCKTFVWLYEDIPELQEGQEDRRQAA